jgi:hypothetical protein
MLLRQVEVPEPELLGLQCGADVVGYIRIVGVQTLQWYQFLLHEATRASVQHAQFFGDGIS